MASLTPRTSGAARLNGSMFSSSSFASWNIPSSTYPTAACQYCWSGGSSGTFMETSINGDNWQPIAGSAKDLNFLWSGLNDWVPRFCSPQGNDKNDMNGRNEACDAAHG